MQPSNPLRCFLKRQSRAGTSCLESRRSQPAAAAVAGLCRVAEPCAGQAPGWLGGSWGCRALLFPPGEWGARQLSAPAPDAPRLVLGWEISGCRSGCSPSVGLERAPKQAVTPGHRGASTQGAASSGCSLVAAGTWAPSRGGGRLFSGSTGAQLSCTEKQASAEGQLDRLKLITPGMISASWGNYCMQPGAHWSPGVFSWLLSTTPPRQSHFCLLAFATNGGCPPRAVLCTDRPGRGSGNGNPPAQILSDGGDFGVGRAGVQGADI